MLDLILILSSLFLVLGLVFILFVIFPPIHLLFSPEREKVEKKMLNLRNWENLNFKDKIKVSLILITGIVLVAISCIISIY